MVAPLKMVTWAAIQVWDSERTALRAGVCLRG